MTEASPNQWFSHNSNLYFSWLKSIPNDCVYDNPNSGKNVNHSKFKTVYLSCIFDQRLGYHIKILLGMEFSI